MPAINKESFLKRIGEKKPSYDGPIPGEMSDDSTGENSSELTCGEQLVQALGLDMATVDIAAVDAALKEAVDKYGKK